MHDSDYWLKREAEARAAASRRGDSEDADIAGHLALAYATLARRKPREVPPAENLEQAIPLEQ